MKFIIKFLKPLHSLFQFLTIILQNGHPKMIGILLLAKPTTWNNHNTSFIQAFKTIKFIGI